MSVYCQNDDGLCIGTSRFYTDCDEELPALYMCMLEFAMPRVLETAQEDIPLDHFLLDIWSHLRTFGRWLGKEGMSSQRDKCS